MRSRGRWRPHAVQVGKLRLAAATPPPPRAGLQDQGWQFAEDAPRKSVGAARESRAPWGPAPCLAQLRPQVWVWGERLCESRLRKWVRRFSLTRRFPLRCPKHALEGRSSRREARGRLVLSRSGVQEAGSGRSAAGALPVTASCALLKEMLFPFSFQANVKALRRSS